MIRIRTIVFIAIGLAMLLVAGCAAGPNPMAGEALPNGNVAGFWHGLWHGLILFFTFIISLFNGNVGIYEVHNNGWPYNLGYLLGVAICFGGSGSGSRGTRKVVVRE